MANDFPASASTIIERQLPILPDNNLDSSSLPGNDPERGRKATPKLDRRGMSVCVSVVTRVEHRLLL